MNRINMMLLVAFVLLSLGIYRYHPLQSADMEKICDPATSICAICPLFTPSSSYYHRGKNHYVSYNQPFSALVAREGYRFKKGVCRDYLELINQILQPKYSEILNKYYQSGDISMKRSIDLIGMETYILFFKTTEDLIIFSKDSSESPKVNLDKQKNKDNLLKFSRMVSWSCLLTILIASLTLKLGYPIFSMDSQTLPILQIITLSFSIFNSQDLIYFKYLPWIEIMFLSVVYLHLQQFKKNQYFLGLWIVISAGQPLFITIGEVYLCYLMFCKKREEGSFSMEQVRYILIVGAVLRIISYLPFNFLTFILHLWMIIFIPISFLIIQINLSHNAKSIK